MPGQAAIVPNDVSGPIAPTGPEVAAGPATDAPHAPGPIDLYRAIAAAADREAARYRLGPIIGVALIAAYFLLRTANANEVVMTSWLIATSVVAVLSPAIGLVILAAVAPFNEGLLIGRDLGSKSIVALAAAIGVGLRWAVDAGARSRPSAPVLLAGALLVGSGLGLVQTRLRWGVEFTQLAAQTWMTGVATMLVVFVVAVWVARRGDLRTVAVALVATTVAGLISLVDYTSDAQLRESVVGWSLAGQFLPGRLTGVIRSPTSTAALVMLPTMVFLCAALLPGLDRRVRLGAAVITVPMLAAAYLTYNRTVFLALYVLAVLIGWRIRRWLGVTLLVAGLVLGALFVPWYLSVRGQAVGAAGQVPPGQVLIASDQMRITAWGTAARMFLDEPLVGQGYRAYRQLSVEFGDPVLNAPHNEWLRFFAEQGVVVGLLGVTFAVATSIRLARRPGWLETGILASFLSLCLAASFNNVFLFNQVTIPAMILAGTGVALARPGPPTGREGTSTTDTEAPADTEAETEAGAETEAETGSTPTPVPLPMGADG